ncbi:MAG: hypothetical protein WC699_04365 [Bacteroidales bacterium]
MTSRLLIIFCIAFAGLNTANGKAQTADSIKIAADSVKKANAFGEVMWPENAFFQTPPRKDSIIPKSLYFRIKSTAYFKDNEYKNPFVTGTSLLGIFFEPSLEYHPDKKTTIHAGAHLLKYHGEDTFERAVPTLSLQYDPTDHFSLIFGTINGTVNHGLIEPVQDFENYLIDNYENGLELLWNYPQFRSDVWLNWEQFLKRGDPFQEKFTAGTNSTFMLYESKLFQVTAPFSAIFRHQGGEIDATNLPAITRLNMVQGIRFNWSLENNFVKTVALAQDYVEYLEIHPKPDLRIPYGSGSYSRFLLDTKIGSFEIGYWKAHNFISAHGMPIFQSVSQDNPFFVQPDRQMLVLKYQLSIKLTNYLKFAGRYEPYYHYDTGRIDQSFSVYLLFDDDFLIGKTK